MASKVLLVTLLLATQLDGAQADQVEHHMRKIDNGAKINPDKQSPLVKSFMKMNPEWERVMGCHSRVGGSHPGVGAGSCNSLCVFKDDNNEFCFNTNAPIVNLGWDWNVNTGTKYIEVQLNPYVETQFNI